MTDSRLVVVTGTGRGLGAEIADLLTARGDRVVRVQRALAPGHDGADDTSSPILVADLSSAADTARLARELAGLVDPGTRTVTFVNNAATITPIGLVGGLGGLPPVAEHLAVNVTAPLVLVDALVSALPEGAELHVLNITSGAGGRPIPGWSLYCSSKSAVRAFLDVVDAEHEHVHVQHVDPGVMDTGMQETIRGATASDFPGIATFRAYHAGGRLRSPREVARAIIEEHVHA